ncbi:MAG: DUF308 domain-containing protein [Ruminococcus bromii]|nr:DUF308 domain-containing protein [Ruminococcus bromii]
MKNRYQVDENTYVVEEFKDKWNRKLKSIRIIGIIVSILMVGVGILCCIFPIKAAYVVEVIAAILILLFGIFEIIEYLNTPMLIRTGGGLVCGILNIIIGICLITAPPEILISYFSFLFAANLLLLGIEQIVLVRRLNYFGVGNFAWVIVNGILNIVSAILFFSMPITSVVAASIIVAIYMIIGGVTLFIESINAKNLKINNEE